MPIATIIIPAYNAAMSIASTLDSILKQSYRDFECLVIDDGSTDGTAEIVKAYLDPRILLTSTENSGGPSRPRNIGLSQAKGKYIFFFDSDDVMLPEKLKKSIAAFEKYPEANFLCTNFQSINENDEILNPNYLKEYESLWRIFKHPEKEENLILSGEAFNCLIKVNFIGTSSVALRHEFVTEEDRFDEALKNSEDRLFWARFLKKHHAIFINDILHQYRVRDQSISRSGFEKLGPTKIRSLCLMRELCSTREQRDVIDRQLASDYSDLSYALRHNGQSIKAFKMAIVGMKYGMTVGLLRSLAASAVSFLRPSS